MNEDASSCAYRAMVLRLLARILYRLNPEPEQGERLWKDAEKLAEIFEVRAMDSRTGRSEVRR